MRRRRNAVKFSVVVPSLNQAQFIAEGVHSIVGQEGHFELECVVVDGGSTDGTVEILRELAASAMPPRRSLLWTSERDRGQADAINKGMARATGEVLAYLNCDDRYAPDALQRVEYALASAPTAAWLTGYCRIVNARGHEMQKGVTLYRNVWLRHYSFTALRMLNFIAQPATFWRRSAAESVGTFDEALAYTMDYDYWLRLGRLGAPVVVREYLADFRLHGQSKSGTAFQKQFREDYGTFLRSSPGLPLRAFHRLHNALVVSAYRFLK